MSMTYAEQERILRKNTGMLPRTWDEATRNANYATPLWRTKNTWESLSDSVCMWILAATMLGTGFYFGYAFGTN